MAKLQMLGDKMCRTFGGEVPPSSSRKAKGTGTAMTVGGYSNEGEMRHKQASFARRTGVGPKAAYRLG